MCDPVTRKLFGARQIIQSPQTQTPPEETIDEGGQRARMLQRRRAAALGGQRSTQLTGSRGIAVTGQAKTLLGS